MSPRKAKERNEAIFKNLTFDQEGNPLHIVELDPEKLAATATLPRYRVYKKKKLSEEETAVQGLKDIRSKRENLLQKARNEVQPAYKTQVSSQGNSDQYE